LYYNTITKNRVLNFGTAIYLGASSTSTNPPYAPASGNFITSNVTSGIINVHFDSGSQQNQLSTHFCNGFNGRPTQARTCIKMDKSLNNIISAQSDCGGSVGAWPLKTSAETAGNVVTIMNNDGNPLVANNKNEIRIYGSGAYTNIMLDNQNRLSTVGTSPYEMHSVVLGGFGWSPTGDPNTGYQCGGYPVLNNGDGKQMAIRLVPGPTGQLQAMKSDCTNVSALTAVLSGILSVYSW
jgi:hypothetical protein